MDDKLKLVGVGIFIGAIVVVLLFKVLGAEPSAVSIGPIEFELPTATPINNLSEESNNILESGDETQSSSPSITNENSYSTPLERFEVRSTVRKNATGISVERNDVIHIKYVEGSWTGDGSKPDLVKGCGFFYDDPVADHSWIFPPDQRGSALVGYIDETPFFVGCNESDIIIISPASGQLYLGMSDCTECFQDNVGELYVSISVEQ